MASAKDTATPASRNTAPVSTAPLAIAGAPDATDWEKEETGFAPYWSPGPGKAFFARVTHRDEGNEKDFVRIGLVLEQDELLCFSGPKEEQVEVNVKRGDPFNMSVYYQLDNKFNEYMESGLFPVMKITALREVKTSTPGQTCWQFDLRVSPADKALLKQFRAEKAKAMAAARSERAALQSEGA